VASAPPGFAVKKMTTKENPQANPSAETAVKKLFLFSMHSLKLELGMMCSSCWQRLGFLSLKNNV
jgi:hypothetical protein